jgi:parallel beta-helix repeat protein
MKYGRHVKMKKQSDHLSIWNERIFVLHHSYLYYYVTEKDQSPRGSINLLDAKITLLEKSRIEILQKRTDKSKKILLELSPKFINLWFSLLQQASTNPNYQNIKYQGWLSKFGSYQWNERYFTLRSGLLCYYSGVNYNFLNYKLEDMEKNGFEKIRNSLGYDKAQGVVPILKNSKIQHKFDIEGLSNRKSTSVFDFLSGGGSPSKTNSLTSISKLNLIYFDENEKNQKKNEIYMKITTKNVKSEKREYILYNSTYDFIHSWISILQKEVILSWSSNQKEITIINDDGSGSKQLMDSIKKIEKEYKDFDDELDYHPQKIILTGLLPYKVNLTLNSPIEIHGSGKVCLINDDDDQPIIEINNCNIKLTNLTLKQQTSEDISAIAIRSGYCILDEIIVKSDYCSVLIDTHAEAYITKSTLMNSKYGIYLEPYSHATVEQSSLSNSKEGVHIETGGSIKLMKNTISSNQIGIMNKNDSMNSKRIILNENNFVKNKKKNLVGIDLDNESLNTINSISPNNINDIFEDYYVDDEFSEDDKFFQIKNMDNVQILEKNEILFDDDKKDVILNDLIIIEKLIN